MTPGAKVQASIELLLLISKDIAPSDAIMNSYFRQRRYAGSSDRRLIRESVYTVTRNRFKLDWYLQRNGSLSNTSSRLRVITALVLIDRMNPQQISALFSGAKYSPIELDDNEKSYVLKLYGKPLLHEDMPRPVKFEYPDWMDHLVLESWGERLEQEINALNKPAPVDLRVNTLKLSRSRAQIVLSQAGINSHQTPFSPLGLRVDKHPQLRQTVAFKKGFVEIQDEGSQIIAILVGAQPGMTVIDFCAGSGGKTLALVTAMAKDGRFSGLLYACDASFPRLSRMSHRLERAGAHGVKQIKLSATDDEWTLQNSGRADRVLADVPCTGTGIWRRNPNAKWRFQHNDLLRIKIKQQSILQASASLVKVGGRLIYATCSILSEENDQQVAWFLKHNSNFSLLPIKDIWRETLGGLSPNSENFLRLSPASTQTDGFFCAIMERQN